MIGDYRFLRTRDGVTAFAHVRVKSQRNETWTLVWNEGLAALEGIYGPAVKAGVDLAAREHTKRGGEPQRVEVMSLMETAVDTRPDAVTCAAALAAWKSWDHSESETSVIFDDGRWEVLFTS